MGFLGPCRRRLVGLVAGVRHALAARLWARPPAVTHATGTGADLLRSRAQLLAENALLRQQLIVLRRSVKRPILTPTDRALLVLLGDRVRAWRQALLLVQPDTLLRWPGEIVRRTWSFDNRPRCGRPSTAADRVALILRLARENAAWGYGEIQGALLQSATASRSRPCPPAPAATRTGAQEGPVERDPRRASARSPSPVER